LASGKRHAKASIVGTIPCFLVGYVITEDWTLSACASAGCLLGVVLSPDLDISAITHSESVVYRISPIFGAAFQMFWLPYSWLMPHRSPVSHAPIVSTLIRDLYLSIPILLLGVWMDIPVWTVLPFVPYIIAFLVGQCFSDVLHWIKDHHQP
jgi:uncharacterized metal-binding protein